MLRKVPSQMGGNPSLEEFENFSTDFRFVVLRHQLPANSVRQSHWDLLLTPPTKEEEGLVSFEIGQSPENWTSLQTVQLPNHRLHYLTYQGPISQGRGHVRRILSGRILWEHFSKDSLRFRLIPFDELVCAMFVDKKRQTDSRWNMFVEKLDKP